MAIKAIKRSLDRVKRLQEDYRTISASIDERYKMTAGLGLIEIYLGYREGHPLKKQSILYESNYGHGTVDNPYALFSHIISDTRFSSYEHYWVVKSAELADRLPDRFKTPRVHLVVYESEEYLEALATCKYVINNSTFPSFFCKREGQIYVNTWHGTPLKKMGFDMEGGIEGSGNVIRNFLQADYLLSENDVMTSMYRDSYKLVNVFEGVVLEEGYPRTDLSFGDKRTQVLQDLKHYGVNVDDGKRIVLYAPTWRARNGSNANIQADGDPQPLLHVKKYIESAIGGDDFQVLIKPHPYTYRCIESEYPDCIGMFVPPYVDANELLGITDVLISDFSSIMYDFLPLNRPLFLYSPDVKAYRAYRGFGEESAELPGPFISDLDELVPLLAEALSGTDRYRDQRERVRIAICPNDDGSVCGRVVDVVFGDAKPTKTAVMSDGRKKLLIVGGMMRVNGITRAFLALLKNIDYTKWDVTAYIGLDRNSDKRMIEEFPDAIRVLVRRGYFLASKKEAVSREVWEIQEDKGRFLSALYPEQVFVREFHRCFGMASFDCAIDFNGYERAMSGLVLGSAANRKLLWQHSDIVADSNRTVNGEMIHKKSLNHIMSLIPRFDKIVSCSAEVLAINRANLATRETYDRFAYVRNFTDIDRINACLSERVVYIGDECFLVVETDGAYAEVELHRLPNPKNTTFITMGRLSPEKNQAALIKAFAKLCAEYDDVSLFMLGDGPLRMELEQLAESLGVWEFVHFVGNTNNPFIYMKRSDCFVFPSLYEGMGLAVNEARVCDLSIIVSRYDSVNSVAIEGGQLIIDFDEDSIYEGLKSFMEGRVPKAPFSIEELNRSIYEEFEAVIS